MAEGPDRLHAIDALWLEMEGDGPPIAIGTVAVCSGSLAVGYTTLDDPAMVAAGAWTWRGFGFATASPLSQPTSIGCADIDRDGATEPFIRRSATTLRGTSP